jgi:hypothetical protein
VIFWRTRRIQVGVGMSQPPQDPQERNVRSLFEAARPRLRKRDRAMAVAVTVAVHLLVFLGLVGAWPKAVRTFEPEAIRVDLTSLAPLPEPEKASSPAPAKAKTRPQRRVQTVAQARPRPTPPAPRRPISHTPRPDSLPPGERPPAPMVELSDAELGGAITAGDGGGSGGTGSGGGRSCDMVRRLQNALRRDAEVQEAMIEARRAGGRGALLLWNGDWIRNGDQDGKGLAGVRQAIMVEVAFAPEACRREPVHGIVLISLNDGPGSARLALGSGSWRWSDLLYARNVPSP